MFSGFSVLVIVCKDVIKNAIVNDRNCLMKRPATYTQECTQLPVCPNAYVVILIVVLLA